MITMSQHSYLHFEIEKDNVFELDNPLRTAFSLLVKVSARKTISRIENPHLLR